MATTSPEGMRVLLSEETQAVEKFIDLLKQEETALAAGDVELVVSLTTPKTEGADRLNSLAASREAILADAGLPAGRDGMAKWLAANDASGAAAALWNRLLELAAKARSQNEFNGKLISLHFAHNQNALATLMAAADRAMTYDSSGQQRNGGSGRLLGSA